MPWFGADNELIGAEGFLIEKNLLLQPERRVEPLVVVLRVGGDIDAEIADQAFRYRAIGGGALDRVSASIAKHEGFVYLEFIPFGMPAKIVVVLQDKHARRLTRGLVKEARGGKTADAATHDDQVVVFARAFRLSGVSPEAAVAQPMGHFKGARVAASQTVGSRWVIAGRVLRLGRLLGKERGRRGDR